MKQKQKQRITRRYGLETLEARQMLTVLPELVADIRPGQRDAGIGFELHEFDGELYFSADDGVRGKELWKTDGTELGTTLVRDIHPGGTEDDSFPSWFAEWNGDLYFAASDEKGSELWKTDGTAAGTIRVRDIYEGGNSGFPSDLVVFQDRIYFSAANGFDNTELWSSDGTRDGTQMVKDIRGESGSSNPGDYSGFFEYQQQLYFNAKDQAHGVELWRTDGTTEGTELVFDADEGAESGWPTNFVEFKGELYFTAEVRNAEFDAYFAHLFRVDRETGQAEQAFEMPVDLLEGVIVVGEFLYFSGLDADFGFELYRSDGTEEGTTLTRDVMPGSGDSQPGSFFEHQGRVYFAAADKIDPDTERPIPNLWVTDGTALGTKKVSSEPINPANAFVAYQDEVYYSARSDEFGWELFKTDGTPAGTQLVHNINEGRNDSFAMAKQVFEDQLLLIATELTSGWEIWAYDGESTEMVDVHLGGGDVTDEPAQFRFIEFGADLVFYGSTPFEGNELFIIRGEQRPAQIPGDADGNGVVEFADFLQLSSNFGRENASWIEGDFDGDGRVQFADFLLLSDNFGKRLNAPMIPTHLEESGDEALAIMVASVDHIFAEAEGEPDGDAKVQARVSI